ncbi:MAG: 2-oxoglutarate dehydrogenase complex dihydrolipoyllysine-residue succinyltransferase [Rhodospirillaceae bacterium]|nr:2-oxoglutarate dehydrogenase complex dihydrolipoyllysine-residue succinyltransferase [Rhodospirillaceae bacterium]
MTIEIRVPQLPESVSDATLVNWHRSAGDAVRRDEKLVELETDKVVLEVPSPSDGILQEVRVADGATVTAGEVLALLEPGAVSGAAAEQEEAVGVSDLAAPMAEEEAVPVAAEERQPAPTAGENATLERAGPAVRRLMREHQVDSSVIRGTGRGGRITKSDVLDYIERASGTAARPADDASLNVRGEQEVQDAPSTTSTQRTDGALGTPSKTAPSAPPAPTTRPAATTPSARGARGTPPPSTGHREEQRVPMTRLRARIAERLVEAQHTAAMLTTFNEVDMSAVIAARSRYGELFQRKHGVKLGFMSFFIKACIEALRRFPVLNASVDGSDIIYHEYFDIGVAVSTDRGLVVPILRNAERMSYADIEKSIVDFGARARSGGLGMQDLTGGTFTLTNGGIFGSMMSTPIINPPQSGILGMHSIQQRPVVVDGEIGIRPMMYLALTYDHRIVDGRDAVQFLVAIKDVLEDPARLLLQV